MAYCGDDDGLHRTSSMPLPFPQNSLFLTTPGGGAEAPAAQGFPRTLPPVSPSNPYTPPPSTSPAGPPLASPGTRLLQGFEAFSVSRAVSMPVTSDTSGAGDENLPRLPPFRDILSLSGLSSPSPPLPNEGNTSMSIGRCLSSQEFLQRHSSQGDMDDTFSTNGGGESLIPRLSLISLPDPLISDDQQRQQQIQQATQLQLQQQQQQQQQKQHKIQPFNTPQPHSLHAHLPLAMQPRYPVFRDGIAAQNLALPSFNNLHSQQGMGLVHGSDLGHLPSPHSSPKDILADSVPAKKMSSGRLCRHPGCKKTAQTGGFCRPHGGGSRCKHPGCTKCAQKGGFCTRHGGGVRCGVPGCPKGAQVGGFCVAHGGGRRCQKVGCKKSAQKGNYCVSHGGAWRCRVPGCEKLDAGRGLCIRHGGGRRCQEKDCHKLDKGGGYCVAHGKNTSKEDPAVTASRP